MKSKAGIRIDFGPWTYTVQIAPKPLRDEKRRRCSGLAVWEAREVLICPTVPARERVRVLMHELAHVWRHHFGTPLSDEEADANNLATFTVLVNRQLEAQGGEQALMRLTPDGWLDAGAVTDLAAVDVGAECKCGTKFSPAQIVTGPSAYNATWAMPAVERSVWCDYCQHVVRWAESCTGAGRPSGRVLGEPAFVTGDEAAEFLRANGERAGVLVGGDVGG